MTKVSNFNIERSFEQAAARLDKTARGKRRRRSDAGKSRTAKPVETHLRELLAGHRRPRMKELLSDLETFCRSHDLRTISRATVYQFMARVRTTEHRVGELPPVVRAALYNLDDDAMVPAAQLAFYCFNYGDLGAMSFAAGLPWLALFQAARMRGWRFRSKGVLEAVMRVRRI